MSASADHPQHELLERASAIGLNSKQPRNVAERRNAHDAKLRITGSFLALALAKSIRSIHILLVSILHKPKAPDVGNRCC